jgi:5-methyltetrahydrofolate--homocysteine methyltransferase
VKPNFYYWRNSVNSHIKRISEAIINGDLKGIENLVDAALNERTLPDHLLNQGMIPAMDEVGKRFEEGSIYVPEMLISAHTMQAALKILKPLLVDSGVKPAGKVVMATVKGDLHDIGKNLVCMMLEGAGYSIIDMGVNVSPEDIVQKVQEEDPDALGLSALLTTTMVSMGKTLEAMKDAGVRDKIKILIGGAPVDQDYADEIGADGLARDASQAVQVLRGLLEAGA